MKRQLQQEEKKAAKTELSQSHINSTPILKTQGIGLVAGVLCGLFGVGGGIVMVPLQVLLLKMPIKQSVQTSYGAIVLISLSAVSRYVIADSTNVLIIPGLMLALGSLFGANFGVRLLPKSLSKEQADAVSVSRTGVGGERVLRFLHRCSK